MEKVLYIFQNLFGEKEERGIGLSQFKSNLPISAPQKPAINKKNVKLSDLMRR